MTGPSPGSLCDTKYHRRFLSYLSLSAEKKIDLFYIEWIISKPDQINRRYNVRINDDPNSGRD